MPRKLPEGVDEVLLEPTGKAPSTSSAITKGTRWLSPERAEGGFLADWKSRSDAARDSWKNRFDFKEEIRSGEAVVEPGLRSPQLGAVHAALAHWSTTDDPATIVMPTGTGKTETMLALLAQQRFEKLLVVVPSDQLREQIAKKFETFGVLCEAGVVGQGSQFPCVGLLKKMLKSPAEVEEFFGRCNVVVTTMAIAGRSLESVQKAMATVASHLMIDEAHHITAPTWSRFRRNFRSKRVMQFTATPFRSDRKHVDGRVIFNYPLRKAQAEGYFRRITFAPVMEFDPTDGDNAIAAKSILQLIGDLAAGRDHLVMARTNSILRAKVIYGLYEAVAPQYSPLLIHNEIPSADRQSAINALRNRSSRIIVCVDMLGEGFDLPELKIAALHDTHKSLAITLQFIGRFTRTNPTVGDATVIANVALPDVEHALRELYSEDADWNVVLRRLSEGATGKQAERSDFLEAFDAIPQEVPLQNIIPRMSTVVFRGPADDWLPDKVRDVIGEDRLYGEPAINRKSNVLAFVTREVEPIEWGDIREIVNITWHLYILHWNPSTHLLFIHSSDKGGAHEQIATAIIGDDAVLIRGETIFRCLHGVKRLTLTSLGLKDILSHFRRFTMHMGADVPQGLTAASLASKSKTNTFGRGYENGSRTSIGCSTKGRVWAHWRAADIPEWIAWCHHVGAKLLDDSISIGEILKGVLRPTTIDARPALVPVAIEWGSDLSSRNEEVIEFTIGGAAVPFIDVGVEPSSNSDTGPLRFRVFTDNPDGERLVAEYEIVFTKGKVEYLPTTAVTAEITVGRRTRPLEVWLQHDPPAVLFADNSYLDYNDFYKIGDVDQPPFDLDRIEVWDWEGVNIRRESQTPKKLQDTIQYRVIQRMLEDDYVPSYDIVFDDDSSGEVSDVVGLSVADGRLLVDLYHCKFSTADEPGGRVEDLYAVCGQAQRCVEWKPRIETLLERLTRRESRRRKVSEVSRFERGDLKRLSAIWRQLPELVPEVTVFLVQPGLSKSHASQEQLKLLAATDLYLRETFMVPLRIIGSA